MSPEGSLQFLNVDADTIVRIANLWDNENGQPVTAGDISGTVDVMDEEETVILQSVALAPDPNPESAANDWIAHLMKAGYTASLIDQARYRLVVVIQTNQIWKAWAQAVYYGGQ